MKNKAQAPDPLTTINDTRKYFEYIVENVDWSAINHQDIEKAIRKIDSGMGALIRVAIAEDAWKPIEKQ